MKGIGEEETTYLILLLEVCCSTSGQIPCKAGNRPAVHSSRHFAENMDMPESSDGLPDCQIEIIASKSDEGKFSTFARSF